MYGVYFIFYSILFVKCWFQCITEYYNHKHYNTQVRKFKIIFHIKDKQLWMVHNYEF